MDKEEVKPDIRDLIIARQNLMLMMMDTADDILKNRLNFFRWMTMILAVQMIAQTIFDRFVITYGFRGAFFIALLVTLTYLVVHSVAKERALVTVLQEMRKTYDELVNGMENEDPCIQTQG